MLKGLSWITVGLAEEAGQVLTVRLGLRCISTANLFIPLAHTLAGHWYAAGSSDCRGWRAC